MKLKVRPHATWFSFRAVVQWKIRLYIECIAGDSPKRNICDICASVCVFVVHICNVSYTKIEFLTRSLDGGRPTQRRQAWNFAYFSHGNDTEVFHPLLTFSWYMHAGKYLDFTASISYRFNQVNIFFPEINVLASESKENVKFEIRNI